MNALRGPFTDVNKAIADFKKKFKDKTKNNWDNRENFVVAAGKYTMIDIAGDDEDEDDGMAEKVQSCLPNPFVLFLF